MDTQEIIQPDLFEFTPAEYGADEISKAVHVDASVLNELINIIDDHMRKCGLYHRIFSRIKTPDSLAHKFSSRKYGIYDYKNQQTDTEIKLPKPSKIQDLIGIRINLYYASANNSCDSLFCR